MSATAPDCLVERVDHLVLTTAHEAACVRFYTEVLGMALHTFGEGRRAFAFNGQKINLHVAGHEFEPKAARPTPGALDLCFVSAVPLAEVQARLAAQGVAVECGPVQRTGARGPITSVYVRDPDGNLIELSEYAGAAP